MQFREIHLQNLGQVIAKCWAHAEEATAKAIREKYFDPPEEFITFLFAGELRVAVEGANKRRDFEQAFMADLWSQFPDLADNALDIGRGLIARVNFHNRQHEGRRSGSDLGVVVTRPSVHGLPGSNQVIVWRDCSRGLLAQAKLNLRGKGKTGYLKWRQLKRTQEQLIGKHQEYYALLLYKLEGVARSTLAPFSWQLCRACSVPDIKNWLRSGTFPSEMRSSEVIQALSAGAVGTASAAIIEEVVDPSSSRSGAIEIRVFWPDGYGPPREIYLMRKAKQEAQQVVRTRC